MENKTVFIVTSGSYSDYSLQGVFSTMENAQLFSDQLGESNGVKEIELDKYIDHIKAGKGIYMINMLKNGHVINNTRYSFENYIVPERVRIYKLHNSGADLAVQVNTLADNVEHAIKIANEKRLQLIASDNWKLNGQL